MDQPADFWKNMEDDTRGKIFRLTDLLKQFGSNLRMPYSKNIDKNIFELRIRGKINIRLIYTFKDDRAVIFYEFIKKTQRIER
jgi:hypothetical protein